MGQTQEIAPADAKMYALRDVTATVECIPLITASIMSKKLAEGTDGLVLDVKFGDGAFIQDFKKACELAQWMVKIGKSFGKKVIALVTNMDQPLGNKVGNSLEVEESIDVLKGQGPKDLEELSLKLSGYMLLLGKVAKSLPEGIKLSQKAIENGKALAKFKTMVKTHGGDESVVDSFTCLPKAAYKQEFLASKNGFIQKIQAKDMGLAAALLGCGRNTITDTVDSSVGFTLHQKVGDKVQKGETLLTIYYNDEKKLAASMAKLNTAYAISQKRPRFQPLIRKVIS